MKLGKFKVVQNSQAYWRGDVTYIISLLITILLDATLHLQYLIFFIDYSNLVR